MPRSDELGHDAFYSPAFRVKKPSVKIDFTEEQVQEYIRCVKDPVYFIKTYVKVNSLDHGIIPFELWDWQEGIIRTLEKDRYVVCRSSRQSGKCASINSVVRVRNKRTGLVEDITIGELKARCEERDQRSNESAEHAESDTPED